MVVTAFPSFRKTTVLEANFGALFAGVMETTFHVVPPRGANVYSTFRSATFFLSISFPMI